MTEPYAYDVFISYSKADEAWIADTLLPRLEQVGLKICIDYRDFEPGVSTLVNAEHAVARSERTLLVMTPDWVANQWSLYDSLLARTDDPTGLKQRTIPLLLQECAIPRFISILAYVDFTHPDREAIAWRQLLTALGTPPGAPLASAAKAGAAANPFSDRGRINDPARFFDRQRAVRELRQMLAAGNSISLVGKSQVGKSSLLHYLYRTAAEWLPGATVCYLDLQTVLDEDDFCAEVLGGLGREEGGLRDLKRALRHERLVLLMDEAEKLTRPAFTRDLHDLLRGLAQSPALTLAVASQRPLVEVFSPAGPTRPFTTSLPRSGFRPFPRPRHTTFWPTAWRGRGSPLPRTRWSGWCGRAAATPPACSDWPTPSMSESGVERCLPFPPTTARRYPRPCNRGTPATT
jgi:hypothetical protein